MREKLAGWLDIVGAVLAAAAVFGTLPALASPGHSLQSAQACNVNQVTACNGGQKVGDACSFCKNQGQDIGDVGIGTGNFQGVSGSKDCGEKLKSKCIKNPKTDGPGQVCDTAGGASLNPKENCNVTGQAYSKQKAATANSR